MAVTSAETWQEYKRLKLAAEKAQKAAVRMRNQIVKENEPLALHIANRLHRSNDFAEGVELSDIQQLCRIGLIKGVERYDCAQGTPGSFLGIYIEGEVKHYSRDHGTLLKLPRSWREMFSDAKNLPDFDLLSDKEIAGSLEIPVDQWLLIKAAHATQSATSLEKLEIEVSAPEDTIEFSQEDLKQRIARMSSPARMYAQEWLLKNQPLEKIAKTHDTSVEAIRTKLCEAFRVKVEAV